jgi:D-glycero-D-manno-heptose 1,7-bisphosphate phosphatase
MRLIILDRDGVINEDSMDYIKSPEEWQPIPGSLEAIAQLNRAGYRVVVVTNQSAIGRGLLDLNTLCRIHDKMAHSLADVGGFIEAVFFCPHRPEDNCECRKPKPGLLKDIGARLDMDLTDVPAIGDSLRDLQAAAAVGARAILVRTGKGEATREAIQGKMHVAVYRDLAEAVDQLLLASALRSAP